MNIEITKKQQKFINAQCDEVLFGGAAGGGKSYGQLIDALLYALKYSGSKQIIFRRTYSELEKSIIRTARSFYPKEIAKYNDSKHSWTFVNGSIIDFGYINNEGDVFNYQSAEYDVIRFDELTHFTEFMYTYMVSRNRGANDFPKSVRSSTNPGGIGHSWVKERFINVISPESVYTYKTESGEEKTRVFIPSKVQDNVFLMKKDRGYISRLETLSGNDKKALLEGCWDLEDGAFFGEFKRDVHVIKPFSIPKDWKRYVTFDYGLDMFACYFIAVDFQKRAYVYKEIYKSNLIVSEACKLLKEYLTEYDENGEEFKPKITYFLAPPDLWARHQDSGKSTADIFYDNGVLLTKTDNKRVSGWQNVKEYLKVYKDVDGVTDTANLKIFDTCVNLIRTLPSLQVDMKNLNDVATEPHELTHAPDALRGFCAYWVVGAKEKEKNNQYKKWKQEMFQQDERSYFY